MAYFNGKHILFSPKFIISNQQTVNSILDRSITEVSAEDLAGLTLIGGYAFYGCKQLATAELPEGIKKLNGAAFQGCTALNNVKLPSTLEGIYANAFQGCTALNNLIVPESVNEIGGHALKIGSSTDKATITILSTTPPTISSSTFDVSILDEIIVPIGYGETFKGWTNWSALADYIVEMFYMGSSNITFNEGSSTGGSTVEMDVDMTSVGRYLVIDANCGLDLPNSPNAIAYLEGLTIGSYFDVGGTVWDGRNVIDLYEYFSEEEVHAWQGSTLPIEFHFSAHDDLESEIPYNCRFSFYLSEEGPNG